MVAECRGGASLPDDLIPACRRAERWSEKRHSLRKAAPQAGRLRQGFGVPRRSSLPSERRREKRYSGDLSGIRARGPPAPRPVTRLRTRFSCDRDGLLRTLFSANASPRSTARVRRTRQRRRSSPRCERTREKRRSRTCLIHGHGEPPPHAVSSPPLRWRLSCDRDGLLRPLCCTNATPRSSDWTANAQRWRLRGRTHMMRSAANDAMSPFNLLNGTSILVRARPCSCALAARLSRNRPLCLLPPEALPCVARDYTPQSASPSLPAAEIVGTGVALSGSAHDFSSDIHPPRGFSRARDAGSVSREPRSLGAVDVVWPRRIDVPGH